MPIEQQTRYLKLPLSFDVQALLRDVLSVKDRHWIHHYNKQAHQGDWSCLSLRSNRGCESDILALDDVEFLDTPVLNQCLGIQAALNQLQCDKKSVRLMSLAAGAAILPHTDVGGNVEDGVARLHIPIITDERVTFCIDNEVIHFAPGFAWYMNASCVHSVTNASQIERIHLVVDCLPNPWLEDLFLQCGWRQNAASYYGDENINNENVEQIINTLLQSNLESARNLANKLSVLWQKRSEISD